MTPVRGSALSTRARNALLNEGIDWLDQLKDRTVGWLRRVPNIGSGTMREVLHALDVAGIRMAEPAPRASALGRYKHDAVAYRMRAMGLTWRRIGEMCEISPSRSADVARRHARRTGAPWPPKK